jgi:hypothetical protein
MKPNEIETLVTTLEQNYAEFGKTRQFTMKMVRDSCDVLGVSHSSSIIKYSEKLKYGLYKYNGIAVSKPAKKLVKPSDEVKLATVSPMTIPALPTTSPESIKKCSAVVPVMDENFVPFGHYKEIEKIIKSEIFFPVFITGHSGNGKSSQVIHICAKNGRKLIRLNMTKQTDQETLIGCKTLNNGNIVIEEGPVLSAMRTGSVLLLEELDLVDTNTIMCIGGILEGKPVFFALSGEYVYPEKGFNIIATANTKGRGSDSGRYMGTNILNEAFLERFGETYEQDYPPPVAELKMVKNWMNKYDCVDSEFAETLVKWADSIRKSFKDGAVDDVISTRRLEHIIKSFSIFGNKKRAVERCTARFDTLTSNAFCELYEKLSSSEQSSDVTLS